MQNEILLVAEAVSSEKGLPKEAIFEAIEQALATATKKRYQESSNIEVVIDPQTGEYETFRLWEVVSDEDFEDEGFQVIQNDTNNEIGSLMGTSSACCFLVSAAASSSRSSSSFT